MTDINGQQFQLATASFVVLSGGGTGAGLSQTLTTVKKISYKEKAPHKGTNNAEGKRDGFTIGEQEFEASLSMKLSEWFLLRDALALANPGKGLAQCPFDFSIVYGRNLASMRQDTLLTCLIEEDPRDLEDNQEVGVVELPLFVMGIDRRDGNGNKLAPLVAYEF